MSGDFYRRFHRLADSLPAFGREGRQASGSGSKPSSDGRPRKAQRSSRSANRRRRAVEWLERRVLLSAVPTSIEIASSAASAVYGQALTLTATITASPTAPSEGNVTFYNNGAALGTAGVSAGVAVLNDLMLPVGSHTITASYSDFGGSFADSSTSIGPDSIINTVAGGLTEGPATKVGIAPADIAIDSSGNLFIADHRNSCIREVAHDTGVMTVVAGIGIEGYSYLDDENNVIRGYLGDGGPATAAEFGAPGGVALDSAGNLFIADDEFNVVRKVDHASGLVTTVAGNGTQGYSGDGGPAVDAKLYGPASLAVDAFGNLFIGDVGNDRIREVDHATGVITTVAGGGSTGLGDGGPATAAQLALHVRYPNGEGGLAVDSGGNLFIADTYDGRVRKVDRATGIITTVAGGGATWPGDGGLATAAVLNTVDALVIDPAGDLYIADSYQYRDTVRKVDHATGIIATVAGDGTYGFSGDGGPAIDARMSEPTGLAVDASGNLYIADYRNNRIRKVDHLTDTITTVAGNGAEAFSGDGNTAITAEFDRANGPALDSSGDIFIADSSNNRIREADHATGLISTVAGDGTYGFSGDGGPAIDARMSEPTGLAVDASGNLFIADTGNNVVRKVDRATGQISAVAGDGTYGYGGDGRAAISAELRSPSGLAIDTSGNLYIADAGNDRVRMVDHATGVITTIVGNGTEGFSGDGGLATAAAVYPYEIALDSSGNLYIAGGMTHRIRKVDHNTGVITTVAGDGTPGFVGDGGAATAAELDNAIGVTVDSLGNLYIADSYNGRIRKVDHATGLISTVAGSRDQPLGDGGSASGAQLGFGWLNGLAVDSSGNLFIIDDSHIREVANSLRIEVTPAPAVAPTNIVVTTSATSAMHGQALTLTATVSASPTAPSEGNVNFYDNGAALGTAEVNAGAATLDSVTLPVGSHTITASYSDAGGSFADSSTTVGTDSIINTVAGGPGTVLASGQLDAIAFDSSGNLFIADRDNSEILKIDHLNGAVTIVAGNGTEGFGGDDGLATSAELDSPDGIAVDSAGDLFIADSGNSRIRKIDHANGIITTVAGDGTRGFSGDGGPATAAELATPEGVTIDRSGNLFIADTSNNRVREVDHTDGIINTVAGNGTRGYSAGGGLATAAAFEYPLALALDSSGDLFIADTVSVHKVDDAGMIATIAGDGTEGFSGDGGLATAAEVHSPNAIVFDPAGKLFIADTSNNRVRELDLTSGVITTVAGNGRVAYSGDGDAAVAASLSLPSGIAFDSLGNLFIADQGTNHIREVINGALVNVTAIPTNIAVTASVATAVYGQALTLTATVSALPTAPSEGTVTFYDSGAALGSATVTAGTATLDNVYLPAGTHTITASYSDAGGNFAGSASTVAPDSIVSSVAGGLGEGSATSLAVRNPAAVAVNPLGDLFFVDTGHNLVREVDHVTGAMTTVAGNGTGGYSGDGEPATDAELDSPNAIAFDSAGNLYIADSGNNRVREVDLATGVITTIAGNGTQGYSGDGGSATAAELGVPSSVAFDSLGNLYIADASNARIRKVDTSGVISTVAGNGTFGYSGDGGLATAAELGGSAAIAFDSFGNLFIADSNNNCIREVDQQSGLITTVAGNGTQGYYGDGSLATASGLAFPYAIAFDSSDDLFIADFGNNRVRKIDHATQIISTVAGNGTGDFSGDGGPATAAQLNPDGVAVDMSGNVFIADRSNSRIRKVNQADGSIATVAGDGTDDFGGDGGLADAAQLNGPARVAFDAAGNLYIADLTNSRIREVDRATGAISTIAGNGTVGFSGDGLPATEGQLNEPYAVAVDSAGDVFIADANNNRIREIDKSTGEILTVAGDGTRAFGGDGGQATAAQLNFPNDVVIDSSGNLFIADTYNNVIRKLDISSGIITTVAGNGTYGYSGDGGQATAAQLGNPTAIAFDSSGNLFITDTANGRIREVDHDTGVITTVAGNGTFGGSGDGGPATAAQLDFPQSIAFDSSDNLFIADSSNSRIREVDHATGLITTAAGSGTGGFSGDGGGAAAAEFSQPLGVAFDSSGNLFIADYYNNRVREVANGVRVEVTPAPLTITADDQSKVYGAALPVLTASYSGFVNGDSPASLITQPTLSTAAKASSHVSGSPYAIAASGAADPNYTITYLSGSFTVTPTALTITAADKTKVYGAALPTLTADYTGFVNGDSAASLATPPTLMTTATAGSHVSGTPYTISASGAADADYTISYVDGSLAVTPAPLTITADDQSKVYGAALPALTASYAGFVNGDTAASLTMQPALSTTATATSHVAGSPYPITAIGAADADYAISYVPGSLTVTPAALTVTADDQSKIYGAALPALMASYAGFVNGDSVASLATAPTLGTAATPASHVFGSPYVITASGAVDTDYTISYVDGSLSVTSAPLTVNADDQSKVYGAVLPVLTASYSGLVNGDTAASLTTLPTLSTTATSASHVSGNPYTIKASGAADADYTISYVDGSLSVTPAALTVNADDKSRVYGAVLPVLTASYSGFVNGDTAANLTTLPTFSTTATSASHVSGNPYTIKASGAADADYTISYVDGSLAVTPAPLTVTADDQSKAYGAALPALTASYSGLVNGDTTASLTTLPTLSTAATATSHVSGNPYTITASGAAGADYTISYVDGSLRVTPAPLTMTADDQSKVYGAALPALTASYSGLVNGDTTASLTTLPTLSTAATATSHVSGSPYTITASGAADADYTISYVDGSLTVTPLPVTYTSSGGNVSVSVLNGNLLIAIGPNAVVSSTPLADVGSVTINGADGVANNFTLDYSNGLFLVPGGLTFNGGTLPITPSNSLSIVGGAFDIDTFIFSTAHNGSIQLGTSGQVVNYTNMTPLTNTGTAADAVFKLPDGTVVASLDAAGGLVTLASGNGAFETTTFAAPSRSLMVNSGNGDDTITPTADFYKAVDTNLVVQGAVNTLALNGSAAGTLPATEGAAIAPTVATFRDPNGAGDAASYSANIDWGDGTPSAAGMIRGPDANGVFTVSGTHTYAEENTASAVVTVVLHRSGATDVTVADTVQVVDAPLSGRAVSVTATAQASFSGVVAIFTDGNPAAAVGDFSATIDWGDGKQDLGTVAFAGGGFQVIGSHIYAASGAEAITVTVVDVGGQSTAITSEAAVAAGGTPHERYVRALYEDLLGRAPEPAGSAYWTGLLDQGMAASSVAAAIADSPEYDTNFVIKAAYLNLLGRAADADGLNYWVKQMQNGLTSQVLEAEFAASDEFYTEAGGTDKGWVDAIYHLLLKRPAEPLAETFWTGKLTAGQTRGLVTGEIAGSQENNTQRIDDDYFHYLGRAADPDGLAFWLKQFAAGETNEEVIVGFTGSPEYYRKHTS